MLQALPVSSNSSTSLIFVLFIELLYRGAHGQTVHEPQQKM